MAAVEVYGEVRYRLEKEVGSIIHLIQETHRKADGSQVLSPYWSLIRMPFLIAEALGDLHYGKKRDVLPLVMQEFLAEKHVRYGALAHTITQLFRHPLLHTDEMRSIQAPNGFLGWNMTLNPEGDRYHLQIIHRDAKTKQLNFDLYTFYNHLLFLCDKLAAIDRNNKDVAKRYEEWKILDLTDPFKKLKQGEQECIREINQLFIEAENTYHT